MKDGPIRFGLIGYGLFGKHHARIISSTPGVELAAIAVKSSSSQQNAKKDYPSVRVFGDYRDLLAQSDIRVADIVVPNYLHYEVARAALDSGKHLLLEKPMSLRVEECNDLLTLAKERDLMIVVNHELRHSPLWSEVKRLIDSRLMGRPLYVLIELSRFPYRQGSDGWRWDLSRVGNWILEEPIHFFDLARWYLSDAGEPVSIFAKANSRQEGKSDLHDNFSAIVSHADGSYAVISQTLAAFGHHITAKITCTKGMIWANWNAADARSDEPTFALKYGLGDCVQESTFSKSTGELLELADQISMVAECLQYNRRPLSDGEDGRWSTLLCLAAQQSAHANRVVMLNSFLES